MIRKIVSVAVCVSTLLSQVAPASAQQFVFRHKYPVLSSVQVPSAPDEITVGNDVVAYYTAPVGKPFSKRIPVKTTDVVDWRVEGGEAASGIALDQAAGVYEGTPDVPQGTVQTLNGYDGAGNLIAKAEVHFNIVQPQGVEVPVSFFAHTNQDSYNVIPAPDGVNVDRWVPLMTLAPGMDMRNEALEGTPVASGDYSLLWQGYDHLNRPVAYAWGDFVVTDGPVLAEVPNQHIDPARGQSFRLVPTVTNMLGSVSWKLVEVDGYRPPELTFSSITGAIGGQVAEFEMNKRFQVVVTDSYDGTSAESNVFTLSTAEARFGMDDVRDQEMTLNVASGFGFLVNTNINDLVWSLDSSSGPLPEGVVVNPETGRVSGVPREIGEFPGVIVRVDGPGGFFQVTNAFKIAVFERDIRISTTPLVARLNKPFETAGVKIGIGRVDPVIHAFADGYTPIRDIAIAADTGKVSSASGFAETTSFTVPIKVQNGDGQPTRNVSQPIGVYPEIVLSYRDVDFTRFDYTQQLAPTVNQDALVGNVEYTSSPALPSWLKMEGGRIRLDYTNPPPASAVGFSGTFTVSVTDRQGVPVSSNSFTIGLKDRPALKIAAETVAIERYVHHSAFNPVYPARASNYYRGVTYKASGTLPKGLSLDPRGFLLGSTEAAPGLYPGVTITATDGDGQEEDITLTIEVIADTGLKWPETDLSAALTWAEGQPFTLQLPKPYNAKAPLAYTVKSGPAGLSVDANGVLSGAVSVDDTYTVEYEIDDDTARTPITGAATLTIEEPFEFGPADWQAYKGEEASFVVPVIRGIKPITYTYLNRQDMPAAKDWRHYSGRVSGSPVTSTGGFPVEIAVEDKAGVKKTFRTTVGFNPPHPLGVTWPDRTLYVGEDTNLPKVPKLSDSTVTVSSWAYSGGLPDGVGFDSATGAFFADPMPGADAAGVHVVDVTPTPADPDVELASPSFPATLKIGYSGDIVFASRTLRHRVGADIIQKISYSRAVAPVRVTAETLADGVSFDAVTRTLAAGFGAPGTYLVATLKIEENDDPAFNREKTASFSFEIVPEVALTVPSSMAFGQYDWKSVAITEVLNVIGDGDETTPDVTYALAEGYPALPEDLSVNRLTGAVEGAPEVFGTFGPFAITAHDAYGDSRNSNEFTITVAERKQLTLSYPSGFDHFRRYGAWTAAPAVDGYGPYRYSVTPAPPAGLSLDPDTGVIRADTDQIVAPQAYTVTVTDSKGGPKGTASAAVVIGVAERLALGLDYGSPSLAFTRHVADSGKAPAVENRVARGGALEFAVSPALPSCVDFDATTGTLSADPACTAVVAPSDYTVTITDATWRDGGNALGRAAAPLRVGVQDRPAIELGYPDYDDAAGTFGFKRHQARTVFPQYSGEMSAVTWTIAPTPPAGIEFDSTTGGITANSSVLIAPAPYTITVADDFDGVTPVTVNLGVADRDQLEFEQATSQEIPLNGEYALTLSLRNVIGENVRFELADGSLLPAWLSFDADGQGGCGAAGTFCGTPDAADHGRVFEAKVSAADDFDGDTDPVTFAFAVVEDATPMTVTYAAPDKARVGYAWSLAVPTVEHAVGNHSFSAPALAAYGLAIDPKTGVIAGTPNATFDVSFDVTVTDKLGPARAVTVPVHIVSVPSPTVTVQNPIHALFNRAIDPANQPSAAGVEGTALWSVSPDALPPGLALDAATGTFTGLPAKLGTYGPYTLTLEDSLPGSYPTVFSFDVAMNADPIELEELSVLTKVGFPFATKAPTYDNNYGAAVFSSPELAALGLAVDSSTGVVSGSLAEPMESRPNLVVRDATTRTTSMPVNLSVLPRMRLTAPETVTLTALDPIATPIKVTRTYVAGTAAWNPVDPSLLPEGVAFDTATGAFTGTPTKVQTLDPVSVTATDTFGNGQADTATSNPIAFVVKKGAFYMAFAPGDLPVATKRTSYSFDLVANGMFTFEGMDMSEITFNIESTDGSRTPAQMEALLGLKVVNGVLTGTPADEGEFDFYVTATFADRAPVAGLFHLKMVLPDTRLELASANLQNAKQYEDWSFDFKTVLTHDNIPLAAVVWGPLVAMPNSQQVTALPPDMTFENGVLSGKPMLSGEYVFKVSVSFTDRSENLIHDLVYALTVEGISYKFKQVAFGGYGHACALTVDGGVLCWGDNRYGQVGDGNAGANALSAKEVVGLHEGVKSLSLGYYSSCALMTDGTVKCWGHNGGPTYQLLVTGSTADVVKTPETVTQSGIVLHSRGYSNSCFGLSNQVRCTDNNGAKNLVSGLTTGIAEITSGYNHQCVRMNSGEVRCWGSNGNGQLGNGGTTYSNTPVVATGVSNAIQVSAMREFTCALTQAGAVMCWGVGYTATPTVVAGLASGVAAITTGHVAQNLCVIMQDGGVKCKGTGTAGQLGNGENKNSTTFVDVVGLEAPAISLSTSLSSSCAVVSSGKTYCWGNGANGRLGTGDLTNRNVATPVVLP
ncbi:putative Ig domain-containing protein [Pararhizobium sp. BT-229]|uniref:putative Ig domain-containing protein n=1 Tax=Pararhizobium sp. BT-229 TaxID=2986923 RepID=UPI0021F6DE91|nr:putative Ig domain-containing protein [Pararhizobium sp. BT-229]MCV9964205.1 putative Ig domain-containing protein [Pararhizobium sp. BT-229]